MVNQNKIFSFKIKRQAKAVFPRDVKSTVVYAGNRQNDIHYRSPLRYLKSILLIQDFS